MQKTCEVCGDTFYKKSTHSLEYWEKKRFCSVTCSLVVTKVKPRPVGYIVSEETRKRLSISCKGRSPNSGSFKKGIIPWIKGRKMSDIPGYVASGSKPKIPVECSYCCKQILLPKWRVEKSKRYFCNRTCWALGTRGKGSPVYVEPKKRKGKLRRQIMELPEYTFWRVGILIRDDHACVQCGEKTKKLLEIDHIKPFAQIIKEHGILDTEQARSCGELWDQNNGRTLCRSCHRKLTHQKVD